MALLTGLGQAATVAQLVDVGSLISMIVQAAMTARQNRSECEQLARRVLMIAQLLPHVQELEAAQPLAGLGDTLWDAHELVVSCQGRSAAYQFVMASRTAEKFREVGSNPHHLSLQHLKDITDNFCDDRILGDGSFGVVYKGVLQTGEMVAVKKLVQFTPKSQKQFENEGDLLMAMKHQNIVRLVGYCYETKLVLMPYEGKFVTAENTERFLCLEYMPRGSLDKYISDVSSGLDWHTRCKIIEGICFGLRYLHDKSIIHLDLKPANILLDENFLPKITDFGLSRLFDRNQTIRTATATGTLGYMALEYLERGIIKPMADIFSLGVIIMEVITGHRGYPYPDEIRTSSKDFIEREVQKWRNKLQEEPGYTSLEVDCQQVERCIQIGLICVNREPTKRPTMKKIIDMFQGLESMKWYIGNELSIHDIQEEP